MILVGCSNKHNLTVANKRTYENADFIINPMVEKVCLYDKVLSIADLFFYNKAIMFG